MSAVLAADVVNMAERAVLAWLATADAQGRPNVSPKEIFAVFEGRCIVIAHIASPTTVRNLRVNPHACLSFVDVFVQKGFKLSGTARVVDPAEHDFERYAAPLLAMTGDKFPIRAVIVLQPEHVEPIVAPSYRLYPDATTEAAQRASAMQVYGVRPIDPS